MKQAKGKTARKDERGARGAAKTEGKGNGNGAAKTEQTAPAVAKGKSKRDLLKRWDLNAPIASKNPKIARFKTYGRLKEFIEGEIAAGKPSKAIAVELGVTPARVYEMTIQLQIERPKKEA